MTGYRPSCGYGWNTELPDMAGNGKGKDIAVQALKDPLVWGFQNF
jgi:hypothetical protein